MGRFISVLLLLAFWPAASFAYSEEEGLVRCKANAFLNWIPHYKEVEGRHQGQLVDFVHEATRGSGFMLELQAPKPSMRVFRDLEEGKIDIILAGMETDRRKTQFDKTDTLFLIRNSLLSLADKDIVPLENARVISFRVLRNMKSLDAIRERAAAVFEADSIEQAIRLMQQDRADYFIADLDTIRTNLADLGFDPVLVREHPEFATNTASFMWFHRESACLPLITHLNRYLSRHTYQVPGSR